MVKSYYLPRIVIGILYEIVASGFVHAHHHPLASALISGRSDWSVPGSISA